MNSKNRHYLQYSRFVYFQEYFLFLILTDFRNSNSRDYLVSIPISGIPILWIIHLYQYLAIRVKCEIVHRYLKIPNFCHSVCISSLTLYSFDSQIINLQCLFFRIWHKAEIEKCKTINTIHQDKSQFLVELSQLENLQPLGNAKSSTKDLCSLTNQTRRDFPTISRTIVFLSLTVVNWTVVDLT